MPKASKKQVGMHYVLVFLAPEQRRIEWTSIIKQSHIFNEVLIDYQYVDTQTLLQVFCKQEPINDIRNFGFQEPNCSEPSPRKEERVVLRDSLMYFQYRSHLEGLEGLPILHLKIWFRSHEPMKATKKRNSTVISSPMTIP